METQRKSRRYAVLAPNCFTKRDAKTAHGVIAYGRDPVVAVIDPALEGRRVSDVLPHLKSEAPIVATVDEALDFRPNALLIGVAPPGGALPLSWREEILTALQAGLEVVSGLHDALADDADFAEAAYIGGTKIWDVRHSTGAPLFSGAAWAIKPFVLLTVGTDCAVGKMTVALELVKAACERGRNPEFIPTGQTGIVIAGRGIAVDRVIADFASGAAESLILGHDPESDLLIVEGQGGINNAAYAPVTLGLLYGAAPDALILVHQVGLRSINGLATPLLSYVAIIELYEKLAATVKPAKVVGIALNTALLDDAQAQAAIAEARGATGLPVDDVVRYGPQALYDAIAPQLQRKTEALSIV